MIDVRKLKRFISSPRIVPMSPFGFEDEEAEEIEEELKDEAGETAQTARLLDPMVGYMELSGAAFRCGDCKYATADSMCLNTLVRAAVDGDGCCRLFVPRDPGAVTFPPPDRPSILKNEDESEPTDEVDSE